MGFQSVYASVGVSGAPGWPGYLPSPWSTLDYFESKDVELSESEEEEAEVHVRESYIAAARVS